MSNNDSFIDEVTEEVRRDKMFALMRRYGWIAVLAVLLLVGGAAWHEWRLAQERARAEAFGDSILDALQADGPEARLAALSDIDAPTAGGAAVLGLLTAAEEVDAGDDSAAADRLSAIASNGDVPEILRQIASYKALVRESDTLPSADRRIGFEAMAKPGSPLRLLAEEQLALIEVENGDTDKAVTRLQRILDDAEVTSGLRRRATQLIVALGGIPDTGVDRT